MSRARATPRGRPLLALGGIMASWIAIRIVLCQFEAPQAGPPGLPPLPEGTKVPPAAFVSPVKATASPVAASEALGKRPAHERFVPPPAAIPTRHQAFIRAPESAAPAREALVAPSPDAGLSARVAAGHQMLWMAALSRLPLPPGLVAARPRDPAPFYPAGREPVAVGKAWSLDGWVMLRRGGVAALASGSAPSSYGASQTGAVLRYRLSASNAHRPEAFVRATSALNGMHDRELAAGLSARPFPALPVRAALELRASDQVGGTRVRPAAMVVTELQPFNLPLGARAEFYGQAGYVGGRHASAFADGQLRADVPVVDLGRAQVRAGAGSWAGAQKGASRLDIGPGASVGVPMGKSGGARLNLDWRQRVWGRSEPGSGPVLTLSAGF